MEDKIKQKRGLQMIKSPIPILSVSMGITRKIGGTFDYKNAQWIAIRVPNRASKMLGSYMSVTYQDSTFTVPLDGEYVEIPIELLPIMNHTFSLLFKQTKDV